MGVITGAFTKKPSQKKTITVDFATNELAAGESISGSPTVVATDLTTDLVATSTVIETASVSEASGVVSIPVKAGTSRTIYKIVTTADTDASPAGSLESVIYMFVADTE